LANVQSLYHGSGHVKIWGENVIGLKSPVGSNIFIAHNSNAAHLTVVHECIRKGSHASILTSFWVTDDL